MARPWQIALLVAALAGRRLRQGWPGPAAGGRPAGQDPGDRAPERPVRSAVPGPGAALSASIPMFAVMMVLVVIMLFNNLRQPLIIWLTVPLAMIGVTARLLLFNQPFNFMAILGTLALSGMLIKNAAVRAGVSRMRPVGMGALTTVMGMIPLLTGAFFIAMAIAVMFGLTFATVLTLVIVPVLYATLYRVRKPA